MTINVWSFITLNLQQLDSLIFCFLFFFFSMTMKQEIFEPFNEKVISVNKLNII